jgi:hypothetical protein
VCFEELATVEREAEEEVMTLTGFYSCGLRAGEDFFSTQV